MTLRFDRLTEGLVESVTLVVSVYSRERIQIKLGLHRVRGRVLPRAPSHRHDLLISGSRPPGKWALL